MAIIVDEGEKKTNLLGIIGWVVFLAIAAAAIYYIFFAQPQLVVIPATGALGTIAPIAQDAIQPDTVIQSAPFRALTSTVPLPTPQGPASVGRTDPFLAP
ncbi:MAG TPA: hypothetical protein VIJ29_02090 [Candidatus Paceibacterota bacterium]